jgi:hypothetical protein
LEHELAAAHGSITEKENNEGSLSEGEKGSAAPEGQGAARANSPAARRAGKSDYAASSIDGAAAGTRSAVRSRCACWIF